MKKLSIGGPAAGGRAVTPEQSKSYMDPSDIVTQFTAQVDHFVTSPHVNQPEAVRRFIEAVAPQGDERALDVACGPGLLAQASRRTSANTSGSISRQPWSRRLP